MTDVSLTVVVMAFNRPDLLPHQISYFRRAVAAPCRFLVINNAPYNLRAEVASAAADAGADCVVVSDPSDKTANYSHARALQFAMGDLTARELGPTLIVDHDVFPLCEVDVGGLFASVRLAGVEQMKVGPDSKQIHYLHPALLFLDLGNLPDARKIDLWPDDVNGIATDVGGHLWYYLNAHPDLRLWALAGGEAVGGGAEIEDLQHGVPALPGRFPIDVFAGVFLHYRGASDWNLKGEAHHDVKTEWVLSFVERSWAEGVKREVAVHRKYTAAEFVAGNSR